MKIFYSFYLVNIVISANFIKIHYTFKAGFRCINIYDLALLFQSTNQNVDTHVITIHSFIILCIMLVIILNKVFKMLSMESYLIIFFVFSTIVSLIFLDIGGLFGARQVNGIAGSSSAPSGLNFIFWFTVFLLIIAQGRSYFHKYKFEISLIILYLVGYYINPYAGRIFESTLVIIIPIFIYLRNDNKNIPLILPCLKEKYNFKVL